jgi:hypothetical protein
MTSAIASIETALADAMSSKVSLEFMKSCIPISIGTVAAGRRRAKPQGHIGRSPRIVVRIKCRRSFA